jgi:D-aminoacyl-tRNA deacylase
MQSGKEVLLVSQFTLYARLKKPRPDFSKAMGPAPAREFWSQFVDHVRKQYTPDKVLDGIFGAMMDVEMVNNGPVTFFIDSDELLGAPSASASAPQLATGTATTSTDE